MNSRLPITLAVMIALSAASQAQVLRSYWLTGLMNGQSVFYTDDGQTVQLPVWGFAESGEAPEVTVPGPTIYANVGDSVHIHFLNASDEGHTIHLHGLDVDEANDGVPHNTGFVQENETFTYRFKATHAGNFLYHCHVTTTMHLALGMYGKVVIYPADSSNKIYDGGPAYDRQYECLFSELDQRWNEDYTAIGSFLSYAPNTFLVNGKNRAAIYTDTSMAMQGQMGDQLLMRLFNVGYRVNRVVFPDEVNATVHTSDGRVLDQSFDTDTLLLFPGERYSVLMEVLDTSKTFVTVDYLSPYRLQFLGREYLPLNDGLFEYIPFVPEEEDADTAGVGMRSVNATELLRVYPIPATNELFISSAKPMNAQVRVIDLFGREVLTNTFYGSELSLDIQSLPSGAYILSVLGSDGHAGQFTFTVQ